MEEMKAKGKPLKARSHGLHGRKGSFSLPKKGGGRTGHPKGTQSGDMGERDRQGSGQQKVLRNQGLVRS